jgi:hypothetical protein
MLCQVRQRGGGRCNQSQEIAASAGNYDAMHNLIGAFNHGIFSRESINSILAAYNNSCVKMRSEARDAYIRAMSET